MIKLVIFVSVIAAFAANVIPDTPLGTIYPRFMEMSDDLSGTRLVDLQEPVDHTVLEEIVRDPANNQYWLFTRRNPDVPQYLIMNEVQTVTNSNLDVTKPVKVICHGWTNTGHSEPNPTLREAFLGNADVNVITLDWSRLADSNYVTAVAGVPDVGRGLGQFLAFLNSLGVPWANMHLIGFSLGGHLVGNAGREVGGRVARITSLDPAGPLWALNSNKIRADDAVYVEGIHTDGDYQGIGDAIGDVDFFPNGGTSMPGCITTLCNHHMSWRYYGATVVFNHMRGNLCDSTLQVTLDRCSGPTFPMGNDDITKSGSGMYRLNTNTLYPY